MIPHIACRNLRRTRTRIVDDSGYTSAYRLVMIGPMSCDRAPVTASNLPYQPFVRSTKEYTGRSDTSRKWWRIMGHFGPILGEHELQLY